MTRRIVAVEGRETTDNRLIANGALTWPDAPVPIRPMNDLDGGLLGEATNFRREDDGTITADIDILRPVADDEFFIPFVAIATSHYDDDVLYLTSGRIADLTIMGSLQWPWPERDEVISVTTHDPLCPYAGWPTKPEQGSYCQCHLIDMVTERERRETRIQVAKELRVLGEQARTARRGVLTVTETQAAVLLLAADQVERGEL